MDTSLLTTPAVRRSRPFRIVLAATRLDAEGTRAVLRAARLPLAPGARLVVLHVLPPFSLHAGEAPHPDPLRALARTVAMARDAAAAAGNVGLATVAVAAAGWPATEIARTARRERAELVVTGPPAAGLGGAPRATVARIMRRARLPLLVVRGDPWRPYRRVLCAVDRSETASETVGVAARLAASAVEVTLLHAYHVPFDGWLRAPGPDLEEGAYAYARGVARAVAEEVTITRTLVRRGEPCVEILRGAAEARADVVTLGTHARSGLSRALHGSDAEWLVASIPFDVAVAAPHEAQEDSP